MMNESAPNQTQNAVTVLVMPDSPLPANTIGLPVAVSVAPLWFAQVRAVSGDMWQKIYPTKAG